MLLDTFNLNRSPQVPVRSLLPQSAEPAWHIRLVRELQTLEVGESIRVDCHDKRPQENMRMFLSAKHVLGAMYQAINMDLAGYTPARSSILLMPMQAIIWSRITTRVSCRNVSTMIKQFRALRKKHPMNQPMR